MKKNPTATGDVYGRMKPAASIFMIYSSLAMVSDAASGKTWHQGDDALWRSSIV